MRGLYFLAAFAVLLGATSAATHRGAYPKELLPEYMRHMTPKEIKSVMRQFAGLERSAIDDALLEAIEMFRDQMDVGFPAYGIPPLDPLFIPHINYNLSSDLLEVEGYIAQTTVQNTSTFLVVKCNVNTVLMKASLEFLWTEVNMGGLYDVDGTLTVLPIYGTGPFTATMHNFTFSMLLNMALRLNGSLYIKKLDLDMYLEALTNNFEDLCGGGEMGEIVNDMITDMAPELLESVKDQILDPIENIITTRANAFLKNYTMAELISIIMGLGKDKTTTAAP